MIPSDLNKTEVLRNYFEQMNIDSIEAYLVNGITYQDFSKEYFINRLRVVFNKFKESGDIYLIPISGKCCGSCYPSKLGFCLVGNKSKNYMTLIIHEYDGIIEDVKECANFKMDTVLCERKEQFCIDERTGIIALGNSEF